MANSGKFREALTIREDTFGDVGRCPWAATCDVEVDGVNVMERFQREAPFHSLGFFLAAATAASLASRVLPSRRPC